MNPIGTIKRFAMRAVLAAGGVPMPESALEDACRAATPAMLHSDFSLALSELQAGEFFIGTRDELDGSVSWMLTTKGTLRAKQL